MAEQGRLSEEVPQWAPRKVDPLCLRGRTSVCDTQLLLPDCNAPDELLIRRAEEGLELTAVHMKGTMFSPVIIQDPANCGAVLEAITSMPDSTVWLWMQIVSGRYSTTARLHKMFPQLYRTANCQRGQLGVPKHFFGALSHYVSMVPRSRHRGSQPKLACYHTGP